MKPHFFAILLSTSLALSACANLKDVANFAAESSIISSNSAAINNSGAASIVASYGLKQLDTSKFGDQQKVADGAATALSNYMGALSQLADGKLANVDTSVGSIKSSLSSLGALNADASNASTAAQKLADWLLTSVKTAEAAKMIADNNANVQDIAKFLSNYAQAIENDYINLKVGVDAYYSNLRLNPADSKQCPVPVQCTATDALIDRYRATDDISLDAKVKAAGAASTAFKKIADDHQTLAKNADSLDAKSVAEALQQNEPALLDAIAAIQKL